MDVNFLDTFDLLRVVIGMCVANLLFSLKSKKQNHFTVKLVCYGIAALIYSQLYYLIRYVLNLIDITPVTLIFTYFWWLSLTIVALGYVKLCFKVDLGDLLFRGVLAGALEAMTTIVVRFWLVKAVWQELEISYTFLYVVLTIIIYTAIYAAVYFAFIRKQCREDGLSVVSDRKTVAANAIMLFVLTLITHVMGGVFDEVITKLADYPQLYTQYRQLQYFCISLHLVFCLGMFAMLYVSNSMHKAKSEKNFFEQMMHMQEKQYAISKESEETIKRLSHDLKYKLRALKNPQATNSDEIIAELQDGVDYYDSLIRTDNETLNALLTEKNLFCIKNDIRLSCIVNSSELDFIKIIDLYVLLGNALDNAIEGVSKLADKERRTISFSINIRERFIHINIENYYDGIIEFKDNMPVTAKKEKEIHGYGLTSIRSIAHKYDGDVSISTENGIFSLQILIPIP